MAMKFTFLFLKVAGRGGGLPVQEIFLIKIFLCFPKLYHVVCTSEFFFVLKTHFSNQNLSDAKTLKTKYEHFDPMFQIKKQKKFCAHIASGCNWFKRSPISLDQINRYFILTFLHKMQKICTQFQNQSPATGVFI